ncbi:hypothetical protein Leryth_010234 [Lithospermum erythrorhizon]|nr:hypothetical protein Leryth_010234 [Lithospermum erythrorhizon]
MCLTIMLGLADSTSRESIRERGHRGPIRCISAFLSRVTGDSDDGCIVCSGSLDGVIKMWKVTCTNNTPQESSQTGCDYIANAEIAIETSIDTTVTETTDDPEMEVTGDGAGESALEGRGRTLTNNL